MKREISILTLPVVGAEEVLEYEGYNRASRYRSDGISSDELRKKARGTENKGKCWDRPDINIEDNSKDLLTLNLWCKSSVTTGVNIQ